MALWIDDLACALSKVCTLALRKATLEDQAQLVDLFATARPFLASLPLTTAQRTVFIKQQYAMQQQSWLVLPSPVHTVLVDNGDSLIGQISCYQTTQVIHVVELIISAHQQRQGYAKQLISALQHCAQSQGKQLQLSVQTDNVPALRLYQSLGFAVVEQQPLDWLLTWPNSDRQIYLPADVAATTLANYA